MRIDSSAQCSRHCERLNESYAPGKLECFQNGVTGPSGEANGLRAVDSQWLGGLRAILSATHHTHPSLGHSSQSAEHLVSVESWL